MHRADLLPVHEAYSKYGSGRVSCAFCIMQSAADQLAALRDWKNHDLYQHLVEMEARSTFSFQPGRWLAEASPSIIAPSLWALVRTGQKRAAERRQLEDGLPKGLRYVKGWPLRAPTHDEAAQVVAARRVILGHHGLDDRFRTPEAVIWRFNELMALKDERAAA